MINFWKTSIRLYYLSNNYGDRLSFYIIKKLSNKNVVFSQPFCISRFMKFWMSFLYHGIIHNSWNKNLISFNPFEPTLIAIGSLLEPSTKKCICWGTGCDRKNAKIKGGIFLACRGPISAKILSANKLTTPSIYGDPAILLPLLYKPKLNKKDNNIIGVIPHYTEYKKIKNIIDSFNNSYIKVINLRSNDIEKTTDEICACKYTLSTSLHGIIVSHSYNIPSLRIKLGKISGDGIKFDDYFLSVGINIYEAISFFEINWNDYNSIVHLFNINVKKYLPPMWNDKLYQYQKQLLEVAPFQIKDIPYA